MFHLIVCHQIYWLLSFITSSIIFYNIQWALIHPCTMKEGTNIILLAGVDLGGPREPVPPPSKIFYLHVTSTINSMKISFN